MKQALRAAIGIGMLAIILAFANRSAGWAQVAGWSGAAVTIPATLIWRKKYPRDLILTGRPPAL